MTAPAKPLNTQSAELTVADLCAELQAAGLVLTAERPARKPPTLVVAPRARITERVASAIRSHKPGLIYSLAGRGPTTPHACSFCQHEFVSEPGDRCSTCAQLVRRPLRFAPGSIEESEFLRALQARLNPEKLLPTDPPSAVPTQLVTVRTVL